MVRFGDVASELEAEPSVAGLTTHHAVALEHPSCPLAAWQTVQTPRDFNLDMYRAALERVRCAGISDLALAIEKASLVKHYCSLEITSKSSKISGNPLINEHRVRGAVSADIW